MESFEDAEQEENAEDTHQSFNICCIINKMGKKKKRNFYIHKVLLQVWCGFC